MQLEASLAALQRQLDVLGKMASGKPNSDARHELDRLRLVKRDYVAQIDQLRLQLNAVHTQEAQWR